MAWGTDWRGMMIFRYSLQTRIVVAFCIFGATLGTVYGFAIFLSLDFIDDRLVDSRLALEAEHISDHYQEDSALPSGVSPHIEVYPKIDFLPDFAKQFATELGAGIHEFDHAGKEYHLAVKTLPGSDNHLYLLYDVSSLEFTEQRKILLTMALIAGAVLVTALGLWIGLLTSRKVIAPVIHLANLVSQPDMDNLPTDISGSFSNDEVGALSKALEDGMRRIRFFIEREQQFTRDASHELRTPLTVIKGAVEVLLLRTDWKGKSVHRPFNRIKRAVFDMDHIIKTFLWLAREDVDIDLNQFCDVVRVANETVVQSRDLFDDKPISLELIENEHPIVKAPDTAFQVVITNLINNAFHNTAAGTIVINICSDRIIVSDTGKGIDASDLLTVTEAHVRGKNSPGFGLGLAIVKKICHRFGWKFHIDSKVGEGTAVQIHFVSSG